MLDNILKQKLQPFWHCLYICDPLNEDIDLFGVSLRITEGGNVWH